MYKNRLNSKSGISSIKSGNDNWYVIVSTITGRTVNLGTSSTTTRNANRYAIANTVTGKIENGRI